MSDQPSASNPNLARDSRAYDHDRDSDRSEKYAVTHTVRLDPSTLALASRALDIWEGKQNAETQATIDDLTSRVKTLNDKLTAAQQSTAKPKPVV